MNAFVEVQDFYRTMLVKRAADALMPDYKTDSADMAEKELEKNKADQKDQLSTLFNSAESAGTTATKALDKTLPEATNGDVQTSNPLVKIAMNKAFFSTLRELEFLKTASAEYLRMVYTGFSDELEKIAAVPQLFTTKGVGNMLGGAAKAVAKRPPPIPAAAMKPTSWKPGSVVTGTSLVGGGVPGGGGSSVNWGRFAR
jgi:hypothetical protein